MKHKTKIQLRFKDLDSLGHVNNANFVTYFELSRVDYFRAVMGTKKIDWSTEGIILKKIEMLFNAPILLENEIYVYTRVSRFGTKSFDMSCSIVNQLSDREVEVASGLAVVVCLNYKTGKTIEIPPLWKQKIIEFEEKSD